MHMLADGSGGASPTRETRKRRIRGGRGQNTDRRMRIRRVNDLTQAMDVRRALFGPISSPPRATSRRHSRASGYARVQLSMVMSLGVRSGDRVAPAPVFEGDLDAMLRSGESMSCVSRGRKTRVKTTQSTMDERSHGPCRSATCRGRLKPRHFSETCLCNGDQKIQCQPL